MRKDQVESTFGVNINILGTKRLVEIEYIRSILEILINAYANNNFRETLDLSVILKKITSTGFFKSAIVNLFLFFREIFIFMNLIVSTKRNLKTSLP